MSRVLQPLNAAPGSDPSLFLFGTCLRQPQVSLRAIPSSSLAYFSLSVCGVSGRGTRLKLFAAQMYKVSLYHSMTVS
ncbi:hypothetical protein SAMN04488061_2409 [Filomicrobium insigne]|uniref:Uncharacterized protein n=1 Tax=Filomicrobium insigne TaxID=418854 RepID=A0A1H0QKJ5_9HYPH|nr:hypothetical protein SAMN04488061_2409 [Filomicrobium insigne]